MGDFCNAWWQQTYQVKSIVLRHVRTLRTTYTTEIYLVIVLSHIERKNKCVCFQMPNNKISSEGVVSHDVVYYSSSLLVTK